MYASNITGNKVLDYFEPWSALRSDAVKECKGNCSVR